jgi:hypothetical protein
MRRFLYSRWFFLFLAITCILDLGIDLSVDLWGRLEFRYLSIAMDLIILFMALWIFTDLQRRKPKNGGDPRR